MPAGTFGHQARRDVARTVSEDLQIELTDLRGHHLRRRPVQRILIELGLGITLLIAQMLGQLDQQPALQLP